MNMDILERAADAVRELMPDAHPSATMILGSGWSDVAGAFEVRRRVPYEDIPGLGRARVKGHAGTLLLTEHRGAQVLVFQGRRHWYEGEGWEPVALPVYVAKTLGAEVVILTNAAGGIRPTLTPGTLMIVEDHINAMGANPLVGPHDPFWGPRFPDMSRTHDPELRDLMKRAAAQIGERIENGVYIAVSGPTYETPAEIQAFARLGADAIGMSTVPEATLARAAGLRVTALSCITNAAAGIGAGNLSHAEVIEATRNAQPRMKRLLIAFMSLLLDQSPRQPADE